MHRRFRLSGLIFSVAMVVAFVSGCGTKEATKDASTTFPLKVTASNGEIEVPAQPTRVVSLSPTATEMLFAVGAGAQTVAVDDQSSYPKEAPRTALSGYTPNAEAVIGYKPNLVVVSNDSNNLVASLTAAHIPVLVESAATNIDDVYDQMIDIGAATGNKDRAVQVTDKMRDDIRLITSSVEKKTPQPTYFYELDNTYFTVTSNSFAGSILSTLGLKNIADASGGSNAYPQMSAESVIAANPNMMFLADAECCGQSAATVAQRPGWASSNAVKGNGVFVLNGDLASRWGPRVVDLVREMEKDIKQYETANRS